MDSMLMLPEQLDVRGVSRRINYDFRPCISILKQMERPDLAEYEKLQVMVGILYIDEIEEESFSEAAEKAVWFLNIGEDSNAREMGIDYGRLYSWEQDGRFIFAAVDKVLGYSSRRADDLHWWEFIGAFYEIGECTFSTLVHQRKLRKKGKQTDTDKEWWNENKGIAQLRIEKELTAEESEALRRFEELLARGGNQDGSI